MRRAPMTASRAWVGRLETDDWNDPIVDGWLVDLSEFVGKSYEAIAQASGRGDR